MDMHAKRRPQIVERSYDYKKFDDNYHRDELVAIDTLLKEFPNAPILRIHFRPSPNPTVRHTPPRDLWTADFDL
jgi:hypothetical protein